MKKSKTCIILFVLLFQKIDAQNIGKDAIDRYVQQYIKQRHIPGCAIAIIKNNKVVKMKGYGVASLEYDVPVNTKTKLLLDSETKLFSAIAIMKLKEQGKIKIDDPINLYLDSIPPAWQKVTIRNLITHSSGIHDDYIPYYNGVSLMEYSEQELYHQALLQPLDFKPGERTRYNNLGFFLATILIQKVTHVTYQTFMADSFFAPLGLKSISFAPQDAVVKNYATAYALKNDTIVHMRDYALSQQGFSYMMKASVEELVKFDKLFNEEKVIGKESIIEMRRPFITNDDISTMDEMYPFFDGMAYSISFLDGYSMYSKGGASGCLYMQIPGRHLTVLILANQGGGYYNSYELGIHLTRLADTSFSNIGEYTPYEYQATMQKLQAMLPDKNRITHQIAKDPDPLLTKNIKEVFIDFMAGKFDSGKINQRFFSMAASPFFAQLKKDIKQLKSFTYAAQFKMHDRNLILYGEHVDRVMVYNVKIADIVFPMFFYLSDNGQIVVLHYT